MCIRDRPKAAEDAKMLEEFARKSEGPDFKLEAYDWAYFAEKMRKEQYDIDEAQLSEYFVLDNVLHDGCLLYTSLLVDYHLCLWPGSGLPTA